MKAFECDHCGNLVFFENVKCVKCEHHLGFLPEVMDLTALEAKPDETWQALTPLTHGKLHRKCNNAQHQVCNWLLPNSLSGFCVACSLNRTIPDLSIPSNQARWAKLELAKHHLVYTLLRLRLPLDGSVEDNRTIAMPFDSIFWPTRRVRSPF